ncbi:hypothetical protein LTR09_010738 [Extremus antarcticus]|uniref:ABM domain-containing protein n=1 Tax=Extremus antarcticus TaxID=702011 RepID=A0AAJ0DD87_9PEZI|nr:hypothetical protein LTR09_010738 [Extremus antarcticus]
MKDSIIVIASLKIAKGKKEEAEAIWRSLVSNIEETEDGKIVYDVFHHKTHDDGAEEYCLVEE